MPRTPVILENDDAPTFNTAADFAKYIARRSVQTFYFLVGQYKVELEPDGDNPQHTLLFFPNAWIHLDVNLQELHEFCSFVEYWEPGTDDPGTELVIKLSPDQMQLVIGALKANPKIRNVTEPAPAPKPVVEKAASAGRSTSSPQPVKKEDTPPAFTGGDEFLENRFPLSRKR